jgi:hypothetical protein
VVRAAAAVVAVADSAVVGAAIVAAVAAGAEAADAEIAGNSNRVFTTRAAGPAGMPRFFWCAREPMLRYALDAGVSKSYQAAALPRGLRSRRVERRL